MAFRKPRVLAPNDVELAYGDALYIGWLPEPQGRLTLASGVPILTVAVTAATSVIYTPYVGTLIPLWNGSAFVPTTFAEKSVSTSGLAASNVYDLFAYLSGGAAAFAFGPAWSAGATAGSNTQRGQGAGSTALTRTIGGVNYGLPVNAVAISGGPAANYGTWLGTIATDASGATVTFNPGGASAGGMAAVVGFSNAYNREWTGGTISDTTPSWSYATTGTWRAANAGNVRVTFVTGLADNVFCADYSAFQQASSSGYAAAGVGLDSTSSPSGLPTFFAANQAASVSLARAVVRGS